MTDPIRVLDDLGSLRSRIRHDRSGYWLPLVLFGVLVLAAPLAYVGHGEPIPSDGVEGFMGPVWHVGGVYFDPLELFHGIVLPPVSGTVVGLYWLLGTVAGAAGTYLWYRARAARVGVQLPVGTFLWYALGALLAAVFVVPTLSHRQRGLFDGSGAANLWFNLLALAVGTAIAVVSVRPWRPRARRSAGRWAGLVTGALIAMVAAADITTVTSTYSFAALFVIAAGLFGLAWTERSRLCAMIAVLFTSAALLANLYDMQRIVDTGSAVLNNLLLPGVVLVAGGVMAVVTGRRGATR
ncbi:MAG TPA: hypothetical protein VHF06_04380 [Pseudonocardiaceae bacterium]|jgi:hypothetical protein|nr:hypothetical protein [Pseudonocardiaceae bacterium]